MRYIMSGSREGRSFRTVAVSSAEQGVHVAAAWSAAGYIVERIATENDVLIGRPQLVRAAVEEGMEPPDEAGI